MKNTCLQAQASNTTSSHLLKDTIGLPRNQARACPLLQCITHVYYSFAGQDAAVALTTGNQCHAGSLTCVQTFITLHPPPLWGPTCGRARRARSSISL